MLKMLLLESGYVVVRFLIVEKCSPQHEYGVEDASTSYILAVFIVARFWMREEVVVRVKNTWILTMHPIGEARTFQHLRQPFFYVVMVIPI